MLQIIMKKLILGATGAIGSSLAKKIVDQGDKVHLVARDQNSLSDLANQLNSSYTVADMLTENYAEKTKITKEFIKRKIEEYEELKKELDQSNQ